MRAAGRPYKGRAASNATERIDGNKRSASSCGRKPRGRRRPEATPAARRATACWPAPGANAHVKLLVPLISLMSSYEQYVNVFSSVFNVYTHFCR